MKQTIRVLAVAPYEELSALLERISVEFPDIALTVITGNLQAGLEAAERNFHQDYDMILSRGGTAFMLKQAASIPVIEIPISDYDIMVGLQTITMMDAPFAVLGYPSITKNVNMLCRMMNLSPEIYTIMSPEDASLTMDALRDNGIRYVLCDVISSQAAETAGLNPILITSGSASVREAFQHVLSISEMMVQLKEENHMLRNLIRHQAADTVVYGEKNNVILSSLPEDSHTTLLNYLKNMIPDVRSGSVTRAVRSVSGTLYRIKCETLDHFDTSYVVFYLTHSKAPQNSQRFGISYYNSSDLNQDILSSFYNTAGDIPNFNSLVKTIEQEHTPLLLNGESGTGKRQVVESLYTRSDLKLGPLIVVDCRVLNDKSRDFLLNSNNSPLCHSHQTIYFEGVDQLPEDFALQLASSLQFMNVCKRNHVIFSCIDPVPHSDSLKTFSDTFRCIGISLQPLRYTPERIPSMVNLYLSRLYNRSASIMIRMEPGALKIMQEYEWPGNLSQFSRVINQLASGAVDHVIHASDVRRLLAEEETIPDTNGSGFLPAGLTLAQMEKYIVEHTVEACAGNQSEAARKLGIGRTTLWRILKEE